MGSFCLEFSLSDLCDFCVLVLLLMLAWLCVDFRLFIH